MSVEIPNTLSSIDKDIATPHSKLNYPYVKIMEPSNAIALVISSLEHGDVQITIDYEGKLRQIGSVRNSPVLLYRLVRISPIEYYQSEDMHYTLRNNEDILSIKTW